MLLALVCLVGQPPPESAPDSIRSAMRPMCLDRIVPAYREPDKWLGMDKLWHFSASFVSVGASYHLCADRINMERPVSIGLSLGTTLGLGLSKELLDARGPTRHWSWKDLLADAAGIALGYVVFVHDF